MTRGLGLKYSFMLLSSEFRHLIGRSSYPYSQTKGKNHPREWLCLFWFGCPALSWMGHCGDTWIPCLILSVPGLAPSSTLQSWGRETSEPKWKGKSLFQKRMKKEDLMAKMVGDNRPDIPLSSLYEFISHITWWISKT